MAKQINNKKEEKYMRYPQDCKFFKSNMKDLDDEVQRMLQKNNTYKRTYNYRLSDVDIIVTEFFERMGKSEIVQVNYWRVNPNDGSTLDFLIKLGDQFSYLATHKDEIGEAKIKRLAPSLYKMLNGEGGCYFAEFDNDYCYYGMIVLEEDDADDDKFIEGYLQIRTEAETLVSKYIHQKGFVDMCTEEEHPDFFFYDDMPMCKQELENLSLNNEDRTELLTTGELCFPFKVYSNDDDGLLIYELLDDDFYAGSPCVFIHAIFNWGVNYEWACGFHNVFDVLITLDEELDEYDMEKKAPTLYKALLNANRKQIDKGALFVIPGKSFFICQYSFNLSIEDSEQLSENCKKTVYRIYEETERYIRHLKFQKQKETNRKDNSNNSFFKRYAGMELLRQLISNCSF